jgi:cation:H+ antiporter
MTYFLFIVGFYLLIKGADLLVEGASALAKSFGISSLVIGLTIVAFGTSAPELVVSLFSSFQGYNNLALGNIVGSNISNIFLMLGICALIAPLSVKKQTVRIEIPFVLLSSVLLLVFVNDQFINGVSENILSRSEGITLLSLFLIFIYYTFAVARNGETEKTESEQVSTFRSIAFTVIGLVFLALGGEWIVNGATAIARILGMSEALIGLTIVAIGTSLPELAASSMAVYKGETDLAIGNVVGSNIFNILLVLGTNALIRPIAYDALLNTDMLVSLVAALLLFLLLFFAQKPTLKNKHGVFFILAYISYTVYLIMRG